MVRLAGVEPATSGSTIRRSNQLSYNRTSNWRMTNRLGRLLRSFRPDFKRECRANAQKDLSEGKLRDAKSANPQIGKRPGGGSRPFHVPDAAGRRWRLRCPAAEGRRFPPAGELGLIMHQAASSSLTDFSKASFIGLITSSVALVEAAWKSRACSMASSIDLRTKAVCSSTTSEIDFACISASR
jgi:hypothetical protein